jgi:hypothetical protein
MIAKNVCDVSCQSGSRDRCTDFAYTGATRPAPMPIARDGNRGGEQVGGGRSLGEDDGPDVMTDVRRMCSVSGSVKDHYRQYDG